MKPTDQQITAAARALSDDNADVCNVNREDNWNIYGDSFRETARVALEAAFASAPSVNDPARDEREAFEAWMQDSTSRGINRDAHGFYIDFVTYEWWKVWQARAALSEKGEAASIRQALEDSQDLLAAMLHETRERGEIEGQMVLNRRALSDSTEAAAGEPVAWFDKELNTLRWKDGLVNADFRDGQAFYTAPPAASGQKLTDEQPAAYVPIDPVNGPVWRDVMTSTHLDGGRFPLRPLFFRSEASQLTDKE